MAFSKLAAGRRRSSWEVRRAAIGEGWRLEIGDEKGEDSLRCRCCCGPLAIRKELGGMLNLTT